MNRILNWIGGQWTAPHSGKYLANVDPSTGEVYSEVSDSNSVDVESAVQAAYLASAAWAALSARERAEYLRKIAKSIEARTSELALAECRDTGKPITLATELDIPRAAQNFEFFADAITQFSSESHFTDSKTLNYTMRAPLGVVACISPWNLPLYLATWKIAPALAAGNTVVAKPSELTPMTAKILGEICQEIGLPAGVLNLVHGSGSTAGQALIENPRVRAISFTGSTQTGKLIAQTAAPAFKKLSLELGGKNPSVIFADCDFDLAVSQSVRSAFLNQGQICLCSSRILVERKIYDRVRDALVAKTLKLKLGDPQHAATEQGAIVSQVQFNKVISAIDSARKSGGKVLCGGKRAIVSGRCKDGWFIEPTLIEGLPFDSPINQQEIFGPVATLIPFDSEEEAIQIANSTSYGLAASIWTQDGSRAHRVAAAIEAGIVWINCWMVRDLRTPFGGVKESGVGREGGLDALRFFTEPKNVCLKM